MRGHLRRISNLNNKENAERPRSGSLSRPDRGRSPRNRSPSPLLNQGRDSRHGSRDSRLKHYRHESLSPSPRIGSGKSPRRGSREHEIPRHRNDYRFDHENEERRDRRTKKPSSIVNSDDSDEHDPKKDDKVPFFFRYRV